MGQRLRRPRRHFTGDVSTVAWRSVACCVWLRGGSGGSRLRSKCLRNVSSGLIGRKIGSTIEIGNFGL